MAEQTLPRFDLSGSAHVVAERWKKWKRAFEYYAEGKGLTNNARKKAQLLHLAGMEVQDIFEDLPDPGPAPEDDNEYQVCIRKLDNHFRAESNIPYERHVYRQTRPQVEETVDQYMVRLRKQARYCEFGDSLDDHLRDQLIDKYQDLELKKRLLEVPNITLEVALQKVRLWESAAAQIKEMSGAGASEITQPTSNANAIRKTRRKNVKCFRCGREGHTAKDTNCPAKEKSCAKCKKIAHFAVCCRSKKEAKIDTAKGK